MDCTNSLTSALVSYGILANEIHLYKIRRLEKREIRLQVGCGFISFPKAQAPDLSEFWEPYYPLYPFKSSSGDVSPFLLAWNTNENMLVFFTLLFYFNPVNTLNKFLY